MAAYRELTDVGVSTRNAAAFTGVPEGVRWFV